jgi:hypothetical protein
MYLKVQFNEAFDLVFDYQTVPSIGPYNSLKLCSFDIMELFGESS